MLEDALRLDGSLGQIPKQGSSPESRSQADDEFDGSETTPGIHFREACDIKNICRNALSCYRCGAQPTHIFKDLYDRLPEGIRQVRAR
eukprot:12761532-Alexandrium_andersonii.AAC.1